MHAPAGHTLWDTDDLIRKNGGKAPGTMSSFQALVRKMPKPAQPAAAPQEVPRTPGDLSAIHTWLWNGTGAVPSPEDLSLDRDGDASPFQVLAVLTF